MLPFQLFLTPESFRNHPGARPILRHLSAVGDIFAHRSRLNLWLPVTR